MRKQFKNKLLITFILLFYTDLRNMSSNAALSAARRRRSNPAPSGPSAPPPTNRILQRTGAGVPPPPPFNPRMPPPQQHAQMRGAPLPSRPQGQGQGQGQGQFRQQSQQSQQSQNQQQHMARQSTGLPPLPPPVKTAGPLYGIPVHPLVMFKTHDNKLSEHELSIGDCLEHLKEIDERLAAVESSSTSGGADGTGSAAAAPAGDLNDLINDGAFINGVVDNIMNTTNFASIVDTIIPLKEENEALKQQVERLNGKLEEWEERMRQLEDRIHHSTSSSEGVIQEKNSTGCTDVNHEEGEGEGEGEKEEEGEKEKEEEES